MLSARAFLTAIWISWCILHSLLISDRVNRWVRKKGGLSQALYRLLYVLFSLLTLLPVLWYQLAVPQQSLFAWHGPWRILQFVLLCYATVLFIGGSRVYDTGYFLGLRQWRDYRAGRKPAAVPFKGCGVLRLVRHPWYSGGLALLWAVGPITDANLIGRLILTLYLVIGTMLEEKKLKKELGEQYIRYCRQVPMLIPWKFGKGGN